MTDLTTNIGASPTAGGVSAAAPTTDESTSTSATNITSDFDTYLQMLTAQLQNQDPLNPLDSTDFAVQLATFSGVEQQVQTNTLLTDLTESLAAFGAPGLTDYAGWVGHYISLVGDIPFAGAPIDLDTVTHADTSRAELVVTDTGGAVWDRQTIDADGGLFTWTGVRDNGNAFSSGDYRFEVVSYDVDGKELMRTRPTAYLEVREARQGAGGVDLMLEGGTLVSVDRVTGVRGQGGTGG